MMRARSIGAIAAAVVLSSAVARAESPRWGVKLESGSEYDTNIHRIEVAGNEPVDIDDAPLLRIGARPRLVWRHGERRRLLARGFAGAKMFLTEDGQSENVLVTAGDGRYQIGLPERSMVLSARLNFYEASGAQPFSSGASTGRNFATVAGEGAVTVSGPEAHRATLYAGYRDFTYKPDAAFDWQGDHYGLRYRTSTWRGDPDQDLDAVPIDVVLDYHLERRGYTGRAFTNACGEDESADPSCFVPTRLDRVDLNHTVGGELVYTGDRIYSGRYEIQVNDSNSYGQSWVRQRLELGTTTELPWELFATLKATLQLNTFLDPLLLARDVQSQTFVTIEDENRNSLIVHLARDVGDAWTAEARYALYTNEFATETVSFRRQTLYFGLVYRYASSD